MEYLFDYYHHRQYSRGWRDQIKLALGKQYQLVNEENLRDRKEERMLITLRSVPLKIETSSVSEIDGLSHTKQIEAKGRESELTRRPRMGS